jgi:hypothetical protein
LTVWLDIEHLAPDVKYQSPDDKPDKAHCRVYSCRFSFTGGR